MQKGMDMNVRKFALRGVAVGFGVAVLTCAGTAVANADDTNYGNGDVNVNVSIPQTTQPGVLAMTVAGTSAKLTEQGSTALVRQFTGQLPLVTVTDTRTPDEIPAGAAWYVLGSSSDFTGDAGQPAIPASDLGWTPTIVGSDTSNGNVFAGQPVETSTDGGQGLVDKELLSSTFDSSSDTTPGAWTATADLTLKTGADVKPGDYSSTLTLSLFE